MVIKVYSGPVIDRSREAILRPAIPYQRKNTETFYPSLSTRVTYATQANLPASVTKLRSVSVPGFNKLKNEGWIIQNPYSKITEEHNCSPGNWIDTYYFGPGGALSSTWKSENVVSRISQSLFPTTSTISHDDWSAARDEALTRAFAKANTSTATLLVDVSQWKQTARMFKATATRALDLLKVGRSIRRGNPHEFAKNLRIWLPKGVKRGLSETLPNLWCELRFGWRPLLSSIDAVQTALLLQHTNRPTRRTYRASEDYHFETKADYVNGWNPGGAFWQNAVQDVYTTEVKWDSSFRAGLLCEPWERSLVQELGFDLPQVPYAIWDFLPWSFIVDRFVNVGNFLAAMRPIPSTSFGGAWVVERFKYKETYTSRFLPASLWTPNGPKGFTRTLGETRYEMNRYGTVRTLHSAPPSLPVLRHDWDSINDTNNVIDGIALSIQTLRGFR